MRTTFTGGVLFDGRGTAPRSAEVVVDGNRIAALREVAPAGGPSDQGARPLRVVWQGENERTVELNGRTLMPGMWEVHTHLGDVIPDPNMVLETESLHDYAIRAGRTAMDALRAGITGIRTVGEADFIDVAWREAFDRGVMMGPRLICCTRAISITGGHGHGTLGALEVDGPWEMRKAVRDNLKHGADQIKLMVTGGVMTEGEGMEESQFLLDEIRAATEVAHLKGARVAVHAWGAEGVKSALRGGVDSIEHGLLDEEAIELILEHDAWYVPTICATQDDDFIDTMQDFEIVKARGAARAHREGLRMAVAAGVKIACGSDSTPVNEFNKRELEFMVKVGMTPLQALVAATRVSADLCGRGHDLGTVEEGRLADLVVLDADPLADISAVREVALVMKDGHLVNVQPQEGIRGHHELFCS